MKRSRWILLLAALACLGWSCASKKPVKRPDEAPAPKDTAAAVKPQGLQPVSKADLTQDELSQVKKILAELEDVPFDFDKFIIPTQGLDVIKKDVALLNDLLKARGKYIRIAIEGHTDERGSEEYNLALGERRAKTVKEYLMNVGFMEESLHLISYGEERPKVDGHTPEAWAANRRVHFVVE